MKYNLLLFTALIIVSCSPSRFVKPLAKGEQQINTTLGGPVVSVFGTKIPIPLLSAVYGRGIDSTLTVYGGLHLTSAAYGNFQTDIGLVKNVIKQNKFIPGVSINPAINLISHQFKNVQVYPQLDANAYWNYGKKENYFYLGVCNWFDLHSKKAHGEKQTDHLIFSPQIGHVFNFNKWTFTLESKLIGPNTDNRDIVVEYSSPLKNKGALGLYLGFSRKF